VIPADLGAELAGAISAAVTAGDLPAGAERVSSSGTWRPVPANPVPGSAGPGSAGPGSTASGSPAGTYATSLPFELARLAGHEPAAVAARLAGALRPVAWISSAEPAGDGYLTITVTGAALASLAVRISQAGPSCARSGALRGVSRPAPPLPDLRAEPDWRQAWRDQAAALAGRLAEAAGATMTAHFGTPDPEPERVGSASGAGPAGLSPVAAAVGYAGADAVRYWLARTPAGRTGDLDRGMSVSRDVADPRYVVGFAHADAASVLRWAADLGLQRAEPDGRLAVLLGRPPETALLTQLSWLAERVAGAARRGRPAELPRYLEELAAAWLDCRESCPALPFGGQAAPRDAAGISARLWLAAATRTALAAGLGLIGVVPGERL
jgi:arginyl-tRNA synthetase